MSEIREGSVIVSTTSGTTAVVVPRETRVVRETPDTVVQRGEIYGQIYTDLRDMPSLEGLLADYQVASAVIWKETGWPVAPNLIVGASAVAAGITAVGAALLAVDLAAAAHPNPYISLMLLLGGLGLLVTLVTALRTRQA